MVCEVKHIAHNLTQELLVAMPVLPVFQQQLKSVEILLSRAWQRHRFVRTCLRGTGCEDAFATFKGGKLIHWRWGSMVTFIQHLLPLEGALRKFWGPSKFSYLKKGDKDSQAHDAAKKPGTLDWAAHRFGPEDKANEEGEAMGSGSATKDQDELRCTTAQIRQITDARLGPITELLMFVSG